jgi:Fe-S cluster biogenesis protein NfuA
MPKFKVKWKMEGTSVIEQETLKDVKTFMKEEFGGFIAMDGDDIRVKSLQVESIVELMRKKKELR